MAPVENMIDQCKLISGVSAVCPRADVSHMSHSLSCSSEM
jgi:hypothetical protein